MEHPIQITGRHLQITDAIRNKVEEKFQKLEKHFPHLTRIHVTLSAVDVDRHKPKNDRPKIHTAKALISLPHKPEIVAEETMDDLYSSIDVLVDKLDRQLIETNRIMKKRSDKFTSGLRHF